MMDYVEIARKVLARLEASAQSETANECAASMPVATFGRQGVSSLPHCPRCASYALYRRNNVGSYECETCGLQAISEDVARRTQ